MRKIIPLDIPNDIKTKKWAIKKYGNFARLVYGEPLKDECDCETCKLIDEYAGKPKT